MDNHRLRKFFNSKNKYTTTNDWKLSCMFFSSDEWRIKYNNVKFIMDKKKLSIVHMNKIIISADIINFILKIIIWRSHLSTSRYCLLSWTCHQRFLIYLFVYDMDLHMLIYIFLFSFTLFVVENLQWLFLCHVSSRLMKSNYSLF